MAYGKNNSTVSYNVFDSKHLTPVSVCATFNPLGEIRPDYVQIIQQDESRETFKIYSAKLQDQCTAYLKFVCTVVSNNLTKEIKLTYFITDHVWCLEK